MPEDNRNCASFHMLWVSVLILISESVYLNYTFVLFSVSL